MGEFVLLSKLGGYTRETLNAEPASVVRMWFKMLEAEAGEQRKQSAQSRRGAPKKYHGRR